jgi:hypothetical protein
MKVYEIVLYKHINGQWIRKHQVSELDLKEMEESPFVAKIITFDTREKYQKWLEAHEKAK